MDKKIIEIAKSEFAETFLYLNGRPLSLNDYSFMRAIYDDDSQNIVMKFSRQTSKSSTLANLMIINSAMFPYFKTLYISPTVDQTKLFSHDRVAPVIESSPIIKQYYTNSSLIQNVHQKQFLNGSRMYLRYALLSADRCRGYSSDMNLFDECFSSTTEVLTNKGWLLFQDLTKTELLATRTSEGYLEYQKPTRYIEKVYDGELLEFTHRSFKLLTTPGHNLFISQELNTSCYRNRDKYNGWHLTKAEDAEHRNFKMTAVVPYKGESTAYTIISGFATKNKANGKPYVDGKLREYPDKIFETKAFMSFMGWYLSEGCLSNVDRSIRIAQKEGENSNEIRACLQGMGVEHHEHIDKHSGCIIFNFSDATVWNYLRKFGKSHDKFIANSLLEQVHTLPLLLDALYKGDAMKHEGDINTFGELNTASKKLADTAQLAWMYLGRKATIRQVTEKNGTVMYRIRPLQLDYQIFWNANKRIKKIPYQGKVYCATVPNGTLIVRDEKEKTCVITGNCQDLRPEVIPIVQETMSRSLFKKTLYAGTPKRSKGTLANVWQKSSQNEYMLRCAACNHWNLLDESNISDIGLICNNKSCGKLMIVKELKGEWVSTFSETRVPDSTGYRVCLLHFAQAPWVDWHKDIILKRKNTSRGIFYNETLGLEYDEGIAPITKAELFSLCDGSRVLTEDLNSLDKSYQSIMGIDYGPINSEQSFTVITIVQLRGDEKYHVVYAKKFLGKEADYASIHEEIPRLMQKWGCTLLAADHGLGEATNSELRSRMGIDKVIAFQHAPAQKEKARWNPKMRAYTLNRNQVMTDMFIKLKKNKVVFPRAVDMEPFFEDILNIQTEYNEELGKMKYINMGPDDFFHSLLYAVMATELLFGVGSSI